MNDKHVNIGIPREHYLQLKHHCVDEGRSLAAVLKEAIAKYLSDLESKKERRIA